jgi:hypothetical protein
MSITPSALVAPWRSVGHVVDHVFAPTAFLPHPVVRELGRDLKPKMSYSGDVREMPEMLLTDAHGTPGPAIPLQDIDPDFAKLF